MAAVPCDVDAIVTIDLPAVEIGAVLMVGVPAVVVIIFAMSIEVGALWI